MNEKDVIAMIHFLLFIAGLALLWYHANFWVAIGTFFLIWAHNLEKHAEFEIDWREYWRGLYARIKR